MLEVASAFGQYFDIRCVAHVLRRSVADMLPSIHEALGSELVVEEGTDLRFRCALVREAVYGALPITALRTLHREAADSVLAVRGSTDKAAQPRPQALNPVAHTDADRAQGAVGTVRLLHRPACWDRAWPLADTALDTALNKGLDDDQRQGHWAAAEAHTLAGHPAAAPARTRSALEPAARIGKRLAGQADRPAFGWDSLTEAELRVARLAARALTNREIADQLRLSPHTVESHLRHAFRKLDIRSRVELTRAVLTHAAALEEDRSLDGRS
jgi:DNA-binding CsgD family transcriptional regulator